ncbi:MAG: HAMP domain-containing histidine kinase [Clostridiales Family XIII bacterium]|jgi:signal transduction histidine kinase|nr:HAMP domain-containing histidine kinase [Clostridiales Family XIII bacterium]
MLKKLRNKLLLFNMVSLAAVIVVSFAVIFFLQYSHMRGEDESRLSSIPTDVITNAMLAGRMDVNSATNTPGVEDAGEDTTKVRGSDASASDSTSAGKPFIDGAGPNLPIDYSNFFVINMDRSGTLSIFSRIDMTEDDYIRAAELVANEGGSRTGEIRLAGSHWLYSYNRAEGSGLSDGSGVLEGLGLFGGAGRQSLVDDGAAGGASIVFLNIDSTDRAMAWLLISMAIICGCVLAGLFFISLVFSGRALRPAEESLVRQRQFIADASHELKTPLAIIDANAEAALGERITPGAKTWIERIGEESGRMRGLIDDLLLLARSDDPEDISMEKLPVDLSVEAEREIGRVEAVLFERGIGLEFKTPAGGVVVNADPARVRQILLILLDNAMKYTDEGGRVVVETGRARRHAYLKVSNTGYGISTDDIPHIFDRFYRADKARNSKSGGYGLGLPIAKAITERAGGAVTVSSGDGLTTFRVELPLA